MVEEQMKIITKLISVTALWGIVCVSDANGQCRLTYTFSGEAAGDLMGKSVASAGDLNGDGYDDVIVGAMSHDGVGSNSGRAYVFSGFEGDTLFVFSGEAQYDYFGVSVAAAGDVNNDGIGDVIIGAYMSDLNAVDTNTGRAYVYSGANGGVLYVFNGEVSGDRLGVSVSGAGDVNNDGFDDVIVGAYSNYEMASAAGKAYVFSGQTGELIHDFLGEAAWNLFGYTVAGAGDVDNDGYDDVIVGAPANTNTYFEAGRAYVFSGKTGEGLYTFDGESEQSYFGWSVGPAGDVNKDGRQDLIVGALRFLGNDGMVGGLAYVFSGVNGQRLFRFNAEGTGDSFGESVWTAGDIDRDGYGDIIIGAPEYAAGKGRTYMFSGQTGDSLSLFSAVEDDFLGISVASAGDIDADGFGDVIIGAYYNDGAGTNAGRAYVYSGCGKCCVGLYGDVNGDGDEANILDLNYIVNRIFRGGPTARCAQESDVNGDGVAQNILDLNFLVNRVFRGGAAPRGCNL